MSAEIYQAVVVTGADPLGLGRLKVVVPQVSGAGVSAWAVPTVRTYGPLPAAGSTVWVSLDTGDASRVVWHAAGLFSGWSPFAPGWMGAGWSAGSAALRTGPGGCVRWRGSASTGVSPLSTGAVVLTLPSGLCPAGAVGDVREFPVSFNVPGGARTVGVVGVGTGGAVTVLSAAVTFSGTLSVAFAPVSYTTM